MGTRSIGQLLFIRFTPEFLYWCRKDKSWSRHQNCKRIGLGTRSDQSESMLIKSISLFKPGATRCHGTRIARGVPLSVYINLDLYSGFWCTSRCVVF